MHIRIVTPAPPFSHNGNRVTALRWAGILRDLGHTVDIVEHSDDADADLLVALHARRSAQSIRSWYRLRPEAPIILALTGTDLYRDLAVSPEAEAILDLAWRLVVLQELGLQMLAPQRRDRARVIHQSTPAPTETAPTDPDRFVVAQLAHLRAVKDPLRAAAATRLLPSDSRVVVRHAGAPLDDDLAVVATAESRDNPRYEWLGDLARPHALRLLAGSRLLLLTSLLEGGANVVTEALACGVPVLSSHIDGSVGLLGADYPGFFPVGDTAALAELLHRCEKDEGGFYADLVARCDARRHLADPARERAAWVALLAELPS